jgi:outer membrane protein assembly factor BamB
MVCRLMSIAQTDDSTLRTPLRLWPGVAIATVQLLVMIGGPVVAPDAPVPVGMFGGVLGALAVILWWIFFSRARWSDRVGAIVLMIVAVLVMKRIVHESIAGAGMGMLLYFLATPILSLALVAWAVATRHLRDGARRASLVMAIVLACVPFGLIRTAGIIASAGSEFHWRWTPTPEQRLLAQASDEPKPLTPTPAAAGTPEKKPTAQGGDAPAPVPAVPAVPAVTTAPEKHLAVQAADESAELPSPSSGAKSGADWPGFRGPERDGVVRGVRIETDWAASPPVPLWRRPIGPGWSSFAVRGDVLYTQEQRGDDEIVASYKVSTGEPVWRHRDAVRFWESNGGAGPRATPTLSHGRVYTFGATGIVNALDGRDGSVIWSRNAASENHIPVPTWGFTSSPLVVDDVVIVAVSGALAAYDVATGNPRWSRPSHGGSYSSPHRTTIDGVAQVLLLSGFGATSVAPSDGKLLWEYAWPGGAIVQPALTTDGDVLINSIAMTGGLGTRRLAVAHGSGGWSVEERWTSTGLKPYFNDFVVHKGHAFGFDGSILACIDLEDGKRTWKGGRYGNGQLVLLPDQDVLLVLSEDGELALVSATPDQFKELARLPALDGKTWNHPVLVGDVLLVRNGQEMAAFKLSLASQ